jgi:NADH-quinone oxidoreductase subunit L
MLPLLWLIPLLPLAGFALVGLLGLMKKASDGLAHTITITAAALSFLLSVACIWNFSHGLDDFRALATSQPECYSVISGDPEHADRFAVTPAVWMPLGEVQLRPWGPQSERWAQLQIGWTFAIDALTCVMLLVVTGIGTLIHVYSVGYMHGERGYWRFFAYLNLFLSMMLTLVLAGNVPVMFVGWEGVGLASYLLIGFYYDRVFDKESGMTCSDAGRKAFITNRVGDFGFLLGALLLLLAFGTWDFAALGDAINSHSAFWYGAPLLTLAGVLLFVGATGKSAQIPLYVWLPDAMAGPTPVSALIHAATMVTAGVYMLARTAALFWHAPDAMFVIAVIGGLTAIFAATMGLAQYDIKKILAYSTVSQLGYMFLGVGVGAYAAGIFHLVTHAFFKACLFLGAGSVIARAGHSNDVRLYGGLRRFMPTTRWTFLISTLAIAGFPFLSGFMSKDEILAQSLFSNRGAWWLWLLGAVGAVCTAFYMFRCYFLIFEGDNRSPQWVKAQLTESPRSMTGVLSVLALGALLVGLIGIPSGATAIFGIHGDHNWFAQWLRPVVMARGVPAAAGHGHAESAAAEPHAAAASEPHVAVATDPHVAAAHTVVLPEGLRRHPSFGEEWLLFGVALGIFAAGFLLARWAYGNNARQAERLAPSFAWPRRVLHRKWLVDELYDRLLLDPFHRLCDGFAAFDRVVVDGAVNVSGGGTRFAGQVIKLFQTGVVRHYALWLLCGAVAVIFTLMR